MIAGFPSDFCQVSSTTKQSRYQPETALPYLPAAYGIMAMSSETLETLGLLASWLVPTVVHPLHAAVQARVFGATLDKVPSAETSDGGCFM